MELLLGSNRQVETTPLGRPPLRSKTRRKFNRLFENRSKETPWRTRLRDTKAQTTNAVHRQREERGNREREREGAAFIRSHC